MRNNLESRSVEQILAEADTIKDLKEVLRLQLEKQDQDLKKIKFEALGKIENDFKNYLCFSSSKDVE